MPGNVITTTAGAGVGVDVEGDDVGAMVGPTVYVTRRCSVPSAVAPHSYHGALYATLFQQNACATTPKPRVVQWATRWAPR